MHKSTAVRGKHAARRIPHAHARHNGRHHYGLHLYDHLSNFTTNAVGKTSDIIETMQDKATGTKKSVHHYIVKNPFRALGVAASISFLLGYFLKK